MSARDDYPALDRLTLGLETEFRELQAMCALDELDRRRDDSEVADRVRSVVSSIGKLDPEWTPAVAYEKAQERLLLWILLGIGDQ